MRVRRTSPEPTYSPRPQCVPGVRWRSVEWEGDTKSELKGSIEVTPSDLLMGTMRLGEEWGEGRSSFMFPDGQYVIHG